MGRRSQHTSEQLREMIIEATLQIVVTEGSSAISARNIAEKIGYSAGSIYNQFESIDDIVVVIQFRLLNKLRAELEQLPISNDPQAYIHLISNTYLNFALKNKELWNLLFTHRPLGNKSTPNTFHADINAIIDLVKPAFKALIPDDATDSQLDETALTFLTGLHGITAIAITERAQDILPSTAENFTRRLTTTYLAGLAALR